MTHASVPSRTSLARSRRTALVAGLAAALGVGALVVASPDTPDATAAAPVAAASAARTSSALARGLAVQSRTLVSAAVTPAGSVATVAAARGAYPVLRPGARAAAVKTLQARLGVKQTGWYGPMTLTAVVAFQKAHRLPAQGYVGTLTWAALLATKPAARPAAKPAVTKAATPARKTAARTTAATRSVRTTVTAGRVCPAPGAAFGQGWGAARAGHTHQGMDLVAGRGTPILAVEDGVIVREGRQSNGALRIVMQGRSGSKFFYGHMSKDLVHAGSRVRRGQVIGLMGDTGSPGAVHLHFEYWRSGGESAAVDPAPLLRAIC